MKMLGQKGLNPQGKYDFAAGPDDVSSEEFWNAHHGAEKGREQTRNLAIAYSWHLPAPDDYAGALVDYGCGTGDSFPPLKNRYPNARLLGVDFSREAIEIARTNYGGIGKFRTGGTACVPIAGLIVASNIMEHLPDEVEVIHELLQKCRWLCVIAPYREHLSDNIVPGHINFYETGHYDNFDVEDVTVFSSWGWSQFGLQLLRRVWLKNLCRFLTGRRPIPRRMQVIYTLKGLHG